MYYQCQKCRELVVDQQPCNCDKKWVILICFIFVKISFIAFCYNIVIRSTFYGISTLSIFVLGLIGLLLSFIYCRSSEKDRIPLNMTLLQAQQNPQIGKQNLYGNIVQVNNKPQILPQNIYQGEYYQYQVQNNFAQNNKIQIPYK
ncbi:unnamed protein product [Paramecium sonneborni]|uniref:Transmembrane protein n=1 Tax=Paramecium sonneborni TaxID=65129 RepID=A0A8S1Q1T0_9CILI|nr:unnamed protein product [Paramecium sonneborni]